MIWNERIIAGAIARQTLASKCVVLVDNCSWTGHECDVLAVTTDLRIIDVEVKISRADLKADARKDKWWRRFVSGYETTQARWGTYQKAVYTQTPLQWPPKVWKHYYAMPADIWRDDLLAALPSPKSGVLLLDRDGYPRAAGSEMRVTCIRRATPNRDATRLTPSNVMDIARLANLRMWDAYQAADMCRQDASYRHGEGARPCDS